MAYYNRTTAEQQARGIDPEQYERMRREAIDRLGRLGLSKGKSTLANELAWGRLYVSDPRLFLMRDILRLADPAERQMVEQIQRRTGAFVYHIGCRSTAEGKTVYNLLFVHGEERHWPLERDQLAPDRHGCIHPLVIQLDAGYRADGIPINADFFSYRDAVARREENGLYIV